MTDLVATPIRAGLRLCRCAACLADADVTVVTYYYGRQSVLIGRRSR